MYLVGRGEADPFKIGLEGERDLLCVLPKVATPKVTTPKVTTPKVATPKVTTPVITPVEATRLFQFP